MPQEISGTHVFFSFFLLLVYFHFKALPIARATVLFIPLLDDLIFKVEKINFSMVHSEVAHLTVTVHSVVQSPPFSLPFLSWPLNVSLSTFIPRRWCPFHLLFWFLLLFL